MPHVIDKEAFQVSQFSGPLSYGPFPMVSSLPPFRMPSVAVKQVPSSLLRAAPNPMASSPHVKVAEVSTPVVCGPIPSLEKVAWRHKLHGHAKFQGIPLAIENKKGETRSGVDSEGHKWHAKMPVPYGFIIGTEAKDGDEVDIFLGSNKDAPEAYVIHQHHADGKGFDEDKVMLGFNSKEEAVQTYLKQKPEKFLGSVSTVPVEKLKALLAAHKTLEKISAQGYGTTITHVSSPAAVLRRAQSVGQGKITAGPGPSISMQVRPVNMGKGSPTGPVLPGAGKSTLGV